MRHNGADSLGGRPPRQGSCFGKPTTGQQQVAGERGHVCPSRRSIGGQSDPRGAPPASARCTARSPSYPARVTSRTLVAALALSVLLVGCSASPAPAVPTP